MTRKTILALATAGSLIAAAVALAPGAHDSAGKLRADADYGEPMPRHVSRHILDSCFSEPVECGLVVW